MGCGRSVFILNIQKRATASHVFICTRSSAPCLSNPVLDLEGLVGRGRVSLTAGGPVSQMGLQCVGAKPGLLVRALRAQHVCAWGRGG